MAKVKMGFVRIEGNEGTIRTEYFSFGDFEEYTDKVERIVKEFTEYEDLTEDEKAEVDRFIKEDLFPCIEHAWNGGYVVYPVLWDEFQVIFGIHEIAAEEIERAAWNTAKEIWEELENKEVPEEKREEVDDALRDTLYFTIASEEEGNAEIYARVIDGKIQFVGDTGMRWNFRDIYDMRMECDVLKFVQWLGDVKEAVESITRERRE